MSSPAPQHLGFRTPDIELLALLAVTRRLPRIRGAGRVFDIARRIYSRKERPPVLVDVLGSAMILRPNEFVDCCLLFGPQFYDFDERVFLTKALRDGGVFVDVGAHIGFYTLLAARAVGPSGRVLAVEADPTTYSRLLRNVEINQLANVKAVNVGIADEKCTLPLSINDNGNRGGNSFLIERQTRVVVQCDTLASTLGQQGIEMIAGLKLDIEGFEYRTLRRFFQEAHPRTYPEFIIIEHNPSLLHVAGGDAVDLLIEQGYRIELRTGLNVILRRSISLGTS